MACRRLTNDHVREIMRADPIRAAGPATELYRIQWVLRAHGMSRGAAGHLPVSRHRQLSCSMHPLHQSD